MKTTNPQITVEDFDNAVKQKWNTNSCVMAQAAKRLGLLASDGEILQQNRDYVSPFNRGSLGRAIMLTFDRNFRIPGDEQKPELVALRASLPINLITTGE